MKSIQCALTWPILTIFLLLSVSACSSVKQIEVVSAPLERVPLALPPVDPVKFNKADWIIVTEENVEKVFADLKDKKFSMAIFGLTDQGYEELSISIAKIKKLVQQQRAVIAAYKRYYDEQNRAIDDQQKKIDEAKKKEGTYKKEGWFK